MPVSPTYPGVYVQEVPSGVRTIVGVSTSVTVFIGRTKTGPMNRPVRILNYTDFTRTFSANAEASDLPRYVRMFFLNGGSDCYVMRIAKGATQSLVLLKNEGATPTPTLRLKARNPGTLGDSIRAAVTYDGQQPEALFNLELFRWENDSTGQRVKVDREVWTNLSMKPGSPTFAPTVLNQKSKLVEAEDLAVPAQVGATISTRPVAFITGAGSETSFRDEWAKLLGSGAATTVRNHFRLSFDGSPFVEVNLKSIDVAAQLVANNLADTRTNLANAIRDKIQADLGTAGVVGVNLAVTFEDGPAAAAGRQTVVLRIASVAAGKDVRIVSSGTDDLARPLMLGTENGGIEVGGHANRRPAPTGITFNFSSYDAWKQFAGLAQNGLTALQLDELDPATGTLVPKDITFDLRDTPTPGPFMYADSTTGNVKDPRSRFGAIRDAINAYQAAHPTTFRWRAELWGSRLAIIDVGGEDNHLPPFATVGAATLLDRFTRNVRYASLGLGGIAGSQSGGGAGSDGSEPGTTEYDKAYEIIDREVDLFNMLVLPPDRGSAAVDRKQLWGSASAFCQRRRAFLLMDPPDDWDGFQKASVDVNALRIGLVKDHSAIYFPRLRVVEDGREVVIGPSGAMAGLYARIDANRGVWKAPAGTEADLRGVAGVDLSLSDAENGVINPVGVNAIRVFPDGVVSWGARTNAGADVFASEYKYIPIRRLALFIEESLYRGLKWVTFEPNDAPLWAQIRLNAGAFMHDLFRRGAFQGTKPSDAYFVKCDEETTTQSDRNLGIVNVWVGFAPLKPAEFVILYLQQMAGRIET